jgi:hypothetical protein
VAEYLTSHGHGYWKQNIGAGTRSPLHVPVLSSAKELKLSKLQSQVYHPIPSRSLKKSRYLSHSYMHFERSYAQLTATEQKAPVSPQRRASQPVLHLSISRPIIPLLYCTRQLTAMRISFPGRLVVQNTRDLPGPR